MCMEYGTAVFLFFIINGIKEGIVPMSRNRSEDRQGVWKPFLRMLGRARLPWGWVIITFVMAIVNSELYLLFPDYTERITGGDFSRRTVTLFALIMIAQFIVYAAVSLVQSIANAKITRRMRRSVWNKIISLPVERLEEKGSRELISRTTTDTTNIGMIFSYTLPGLVSTIYYVVGSLREVSAYDIRMSITMIIVVAAQVLLAFISGRVVYGRFNTVQTKLAAMTEKISEVMSSLPIVKAFTAEKKEGVRGARVISDYNWANFHAQNISNIFYYLSSLVNLLGTLAVIVTGGVLVKNGTVEMSDWIAYFMYYYYLAQQLTMIPYDWKELKSLQGTVKRLSAIECYEEEQTDAGTDSMPEGDLHLDHVTFGYDEKPVLKDVSAVFPAGKMTAVIGPNGAGKTTLFSLLERFYEPDEGSVCAGDVNGASVNLKTWRKLFSYVPQDVRLFDGTIRDNLTYGLDREVSDEELQEACAKAGLTDYIQSLKEGYATPVEEFGENLSGGQRQKIAFVRAMLRKAPVLLLDEYDANLDQEAAVLTEQSVEAMKGTCTIIVIAHHPATIRHADQILVLSDGSVQACGTHEELAKNCELYQKMLEE